MQETMRVWKKKKDLLCAGIFFGSYIRENSMEISFGAPWVSRAPYLFSILLFRYLSDEHYINEKF
jgi:hypothetical protein